MNAFWQSWKTTLAGVAAAAAHVTVNGTSWKQLIVAACMAAIGAFAQDHSTKP